MVAIETQEHIYPHAWDVVTLAQWSKYPHPLCPQVESVDVLSRNVDTDGKLQSRRLFTGAAPVPKWLRGMWGGLGGGEALCVEESVVDRENKRMEMKLRSLGWSDWIQVEEVCVLEGIEDGKTRLKQEWRCEVKGGWGDRLEKWAKERFRSTVWKGREAVRSLCDEIESGVEKVGEAGLETTPQTQ
eukprot:Plantae.Rhodophyta-Hildenbrandia_rubra.ctg6102.p2 GENE.Plantae.Rhodophyta-Hildenbrandia_rubra.ctg6102~~Plantae.Rhodophyta-Hildenbrandia_rubra.ctg6102.p2  ORF type:complete len:186 (-),score=38.89 Plantae.Rhodophyta-Hildenbrandia_rubra.ctg6102:2034-2591(-)